MKMVIKIEVESAEEMQRVMNALHMRDERQDVLRQFLGRQQGHAEIGGRGNHNEEAAREAAGIDDELGVPQTANMPVPLNATIPFPLPPGWQQIDPSTGAPIGPNNDPIQNGPLPPIAYNGSCKCGAPVTAPHGATVGCSQCGNRFVFEVMKHGTELDKQSFQSRNSAQAAPPVTPPTPLPGPELLSEL